MPIPLLSPAVTAVTLNSLALLESAQEGEVVAENTQVDARGIADTVAAMQNVKQKQTLDFRLHWPTTQDSVTWEASAIDVSVYSLGGTAYIGQMKRGRLNVSNKGPDVSGMASFYEYPAPTHREWTLTSDLMVVTSAAFSYLNMTATENGFNVSATITFALESVTIPCVLKTTRHRIVRGEVQMENVTLTPIGAAATVEYNGANETTSLLYAAIKGTPEIPFEFDTGGNLYENGEGQTAMISHYDISWAEKQLIAQSITLEVQGGMSVTEGS